MSVITLMRANDARRFRMESASFRVKAHAKGSLPAATNGKGYNDITISGTYNDITLHG